MPSSPIPGTARTKTVTRREALRAIGATGIIGGLAGCLSGTVAAESVVVSANANLANNLDKQAFYEAGVPDSVDIVLTAGPESTGSRAEAFTTALLAKQEKPDLMMMDNGWTIPFIVQQKIMNIEEELSDTFIQDVKDNSFDMLVRTASDPETGELWALPYFPDYPTIQYRKDLLRNVGYSDSDFDEWETNPLSWADFTSAVSEAQEEASAENASEDGDPSTVSYGYLWQGAGYAGLSCCSFNELMTQTGGAYFGGPDNLFGPVGDRPVTVTSEETIDGIELGRDLIYGSDESPYDVDGVSPRATTGWTEPDVDAQFADKPNAVAIRSWTYTIGIAQDTYDGTDAELGVMPMPKGANGSWAALGGWLMAVNPHTNLTEDTLEVLKAFHSEEVQMATLNGPGFIPHQPSLFEGAAQDHPVYGDFMDTLSYAGQNAIARPVTPVWPQQTGSTATEVNSALRKAKSPTEAMQELETTFKDLEALK